MGKGELPDSFLDQMDFWTRAKKVEPEFYESARKFFARKACVWKLWKGPFYKPECSPTSVISRGEKFKFCAICGGRILPPVRKLQPNGGDNA